MATVNNPAQTEPRLKLPERPSFFQSVTSGIGGYFKGMLSGGAVGLVVGAAVGIAIALTEFALGGFSAPILDVLKITGIVTAVGGVALASVGALAGAVTGVVKSREAGQPSAEDIVNVAKISFAQGLGTGVQMGVNAKGAKHHETSLEAQRASVKTGEQRVPLP